MSKRPVIQPELNWVTTFLSVRDAAKALDFYTSVFGFKEHQVVKDNKGKVAFARITYHGCNLVITPHAPFAVEAHRGKAPVVTHTTSPISIYVYCDDLEERYEKVKKMGLQILLPIDVMFWGDRTFRVIDPEGYIWDFATWVSDFNPDQLPPELKT